MNKQVLLLCALALFLAVGCGADKNSNEACLYETTMSLDKGNYDAVLASSCANSMHKGAAYFGKAGYDVTTVINNFSSTASTSATESDLSVFMSTLTGKVTEGTLDNLNLAVNEYGAVAASSEYYQDAQFYLSIVEAVNSLSLIKTVVDSTGLGSLEVDCDINGNTVPDELDATACALLNGVGCAPGVNTATYGSIATPVKFTGKNGDYIGKEFTITGGSLGSCSTDKYKKLLTSSAVVVTLNPNDGMCSDISSNSSGSWPCPFEVGGAPLDLVSAMDQSITSAISSMGQALPAGTAADVQQSITDIKTQACPSGTCTSSDLASYLQTF